MYRHKIVSTHKRSQSVVEIQHKNFTTGFNKASKKWFDDIVNKFFAYKLVKVEDESQVGYHWETDDMVFELR